MRFGGRLGPPVGGRPLHCHRFSMCSAGIDVPRGTGRSAHPSILETRNARFWFAVDCDGMHNHWGSLVLDNEDRLAAAMRYRLQR